jgi:astacin (peptidase family M12A)/FG-GAP repeat protein
MTRHVFLFLPLLACAVEDVDPPPTDSPGVPRIPVQFPWGVQLEPYQIIDDFVVIRGDIIAGRADELGHRSTTRVGGRWPGNIVRYAFDTNVSANDRGTATAAFDTLEARTPIDFQLINNPCAFPSNNCGTDYILIRNWAGSGGQSATPGGAGQVGHLGGQQIINEATGFSAGGFQHEMFHALGMYHEQERHDRDDYLLFRPECTTDTGVANMTKNADPNIDFGTYDVGSLMQYASVSFRITNFNDAPCSGGYPLTRKPGVPCPAGLCSDPGGDGFAEVIGQVAAPSAGDIDAVWAMYAPALTAHESGDQFGAVLAYGDFDGDGRIDLAVGHPREDTVSNTVDAAGAVTLWKGTEDGLEPWQLITQGGLGAFEEAGDHFGTALAAGDFDDDGITDLAIGAPGESVGNNPDPGAGAVYLLRGTLDGPVYWRAVTEGDIGASVEGGDELGTALAVGRFNGDAIDDLAVGAPGEDHGDGVHSGHVYVLRGTGTNSALASWSGASQSTLSTAPNVAPGGFIPPPVPLGTEQSGDRFGSALAVGHVDDDGIDDLVVGAYCDHELAACAGGAYLYRGNATGMRGWMRLSQSGVGGDSFDYAGWAVAVGDVDNDGDADVLVGVPYDDVNGTANVGRVVWARPQGHVIASHAVINQADSDWGANDLFGYSIAIGQTGSFDDIAIGTPGESWGAGPAAGAVMMFYAGDDGPVAAGVLRASPLATEEAEDSFGAAVALAADHGQGLLCVGNPGEDASAGAIMQFVASPIGSGFAATQSITQATPGTRSE